MRGRRALCWAAWLVCGASTLALLWAWAGAGAGGAGGAGTGAGGGAGPQPRDTGAPVAGRELPLIFIGGVPRSGTTLMRAMLDAHPLVRCGQETRVIPRILQMRQHWYKSAKEAVRLEEAGVSSDVVDNAIAAFVLEVIARHGEPAPRLCNKDPLVLKMASYVLRLFPNARFVLMVRDGRATVHSIISRQVTITGFDLSSYRQCLSKWNSAVEAMWRECGALGGRCVVVQYERLVLRPRDELARLLRALRLPWDERVLHHEQWVGRAGGVALSKVERSSDQVVRALNAEALARWAGEGGVPADVLADAHALAPMLSVLGYDPWATPPDYAKLKPHSLSADDTANTDHDTYHLPFITTPS